MHTFTVQVFREDVRDFIEVVYQSNVPHDPNFLIEDCWLKTKHRPHLAEDGSVHLAFNCHTVEDISVLREAARKLYVKRGGKLWK